MIDDSREKLINMMIFFLKNTKMCGKVKLFKLFSFADFLHFKQTGKSISGLDYYAWKMGPVPVKLFDELKNPPQDLLKYFVIPSQEELERNQEDDKQFFDIKCKKKFKDDLFTERELSILKKIAYIYKETNAKDIIEVSHLKNQPWYTTYHKIGKSKKIDYFLALDDSEESLPKDIVRERIEEITEMRKIFG